VVSLTIAAGAFSGACRDPIDGFIFLPVGRSPPLDHRRVTERTADLVTPALVPEIVVLVVLRTPFVVTVKVAAVAPAATVTLDGTVATVLLLESWTVTLVGGAAPLMVTVPVDGLPPTTFDGFNFNEDNVGRVIVNVAVFVTPL